MGSDEKALARVSEAERRIAEAKTPEDANLLRRQIPALKKLLGIRKKAYEEAFPLAVAYLKACIKAGELWAATENKRPEGRPKKTVAVATVSATDVGFTDREDASRCVRLAQAAADDQLNTYLEDCRQHGAMPSPFGLTFYAVWKGYVAGSGDTNVRNVPEGKFQCIVVDPPWPVAKIERDVRPLQRADLSYDEQGRTWPLEEIQRGVLKVMVRDKADEQAHLYLWTTHHYLPAAIECAREWGFEYQCLMTWVKNVGMTPFSWMYSTEHVVFATRGGLSLKRMGIRLDFSAKVREHSRKPDEFYEIVKEASPGPRLDLFSREGREGFQAWGNEVAKFD